MQSRDIVRIGFWPDFCRGGIHKLRVHVLRSKIAIFLVVYTASSYRLAARDAA